MRRYIHTTNLQIIVIILIAEEVRIERSVLALFQGYDLLKSYKIVIYAIRHLSKILRIRTGVEGFGPKKSQIKKVRGVNVLQLTGLSV